MKLFDIFGMCLRNLARRKFRTFLTVIGVVIGTCAIIIMISFGIGMTASYDEMIQGWGDLSMIDVWSYSTENPLDDNALADMNAIPGVAMATPFVRLNNYGIYSNWETGEELGLYGGRKQRYMMEASYWLVGITPTALEKMGFTAYEGEHLTASESKKIRLVGGELVPYRFYDTKKKYPNNQISYWEVDPVTGELPDPFFDIMADRDMVLRLPASDKKYRSLEYEVEFVGMVKGSGSEERSVQMSAYMDLADMKKIIAEYRKVNNIKNNTNTDADSYNEVKVKVENFNDVTDVQQQIDDMGFDTWSPQGERESMQKQAQTMQLIFGALGAAALVVAAISITNTMIMSVYERTREIGVMKVLGCTVNNIRLIFLIEAAMIGFLGGVMGVGISYLVSFLMNTFGSSIGNLFGFYFDTGSKVSIIPPWLIGLGLTFATLIGIVSGFYPANRAVKTSALEAIRQE